MNTKQTHAALLGLLLAWAVTCAAQTTRPSAPEPEAADKTTTHAHQLLKSGAQYLLAAQGQDGGWGPAQRVGVSALVLKALIQAPDVGPRHAAVQRGIDFLLRSRHDDGGIYSSDGTYKNYESSITLSTLAALDSPRHAATISKLQHFLKHKQWDESEGISRQDARYGGAGYGRHQRPDLSNTQMMVEALHDSGLSKDDPVYKKALVFIQRCQMLGESNDLDFAHGSSQGGFIYHPVNGGQSKAGTVKIDDRDELRSYGSITYAGLKSMLYCGLTRDDPRVRAAFNWIRSNWTLAQNPNMPAAQAHQGLFYYYHVFGRTLAAWGQPQIEDAAGKSHDWRAELVATLATKQREDGSWVNEADRWMEGLPVLTTAYSMLALGATLQQ